VDVPHGLPEQLRRLEEELLRPEVRSSRAELEARLAADFLEIGRSGGIYDRAAIIEALAAEGAAEPAVARVEDFSVLLLAPDVALATWRSVREGAAGGQPADTLRCSIWRRERGAWRMVFHQATPSG
jgi:hypothetical protein